MVMGSNPVVSAPNATHVIDRLAQLDFLVVSDFFLSETAELADVVLPSAQWAEEEGTMTNLEGRVIRRRRAVDPPGEVKNDIDVLCLLADRLGKARTFRFRVRAMSSTSSGARPPEARPTTLESRYERIDAEDGVFWPCPAGHAGTRRLFTETLSNTQRQGALSCRRAPASCRGAR